VTAPITNSGTPTGAEIGIDLTNIAPINNPTFTGLVNTEGITNAQAKNALIASGFDSTAETPFAQASRVVMTAASLTSTDPTTRPDGSALVIGDVWINFQ
jgi:hypothetical protein